MERELRHICLFGRRLARLAIGAATGNYLEDFVLRKEVTVDDMAWMWAHMQATIPLINRIKQDLPCESFAPKFNALWFGTFDWTELEREAA